MTRFKLHGYQEIAVDHLHRNPRGGLFLDMGLGKTASALSALSNEQLPALVVAPKRVAESVWPAETALWRPELRCRVAAGTPRDRADALRSGAAIVSLGRDNLKDLADAELRRPFKTIILDELSGFKTRATGRWKFAKTLCEPARTVWGLTGTPAPNGLMDLWAQVYLIDKGARLGPNITTFRSRYFTPGLRLANGVIASWDLRPGADEKIHALLDDIFLSMGTEGHIELPPVTYNQVCVTLPPGVRTLYKKMKRDLVADLQMLGGEIHTAGSAAALTNKLSQMSAGFIYSDDVDNPHYDTLHREKITAALEIVEGTGSPVLIFYRFKAEKEMLLASIPGVVSIDMPGAIDDWNAGKIPVLLAHPASAGHGLNLQHGGHTIVWTTLPWSLEEWQQGNKRLARQGQKNPVVIHMLMADKMIDKVILETLNGKAFVQDNLLDYLESPL